MKKKLQEEQKKLSTLKLNGEIDEIAAQQLKGRSNSLPHLIMPCLWARYLTIASFLLQVCSYAVQSFCERIFKFLFEKFIEHQV